jgi:2-polyprenyl-3-methyl-5-hydroxy-6-metoxy-1,4-benzoquinol methylase
MNLKAKKSFEKEYFAGYYYRNVGEFSQKDLNKSINWFTGWFKYLQKFIELRNGNGRKVLEIGCSIGGACSILADNGFEVFASDISSYAIKGAKSLAKENGRKIKFFTCDVQKNIPIEEKFDFIYAFEVIEHLKDPLFSIKLMKKKLKKNGLLICSTPNGDKDFSSDPTHINVKSPKEWRKTFQQAGFKNIQIEQIAFFPWLYKFNKNLHLIFSFPIYSKYINSPLFIIAKN